LDGVVEAWKAGEGGVDPAPLANYACDILTLAKTGWPVEEIKKAKLTLDLLNTLIGVALLYVSDLGNCAAEIRGHVIRFHNMRGVPGTCDPFVTKTFRLSASGVEYLMDEARRRRAGDRIKGEPEGEVSGLREFMKRNPTATVQKTSAFYGAFTFLAHYDRPPFSDSQRVSIGGKAR
jgi:hypothetical protein